MWYRPDIDGLRAFAVLVVILYHAKVNGFAGGFVGVDVFFVISGFLIARIIDRETSRGGFSFFDFYERRVRRIVPAVTIVLLASMPASLWLLSPDDLKDYFQSVTATCLCCSNALFWKETGYFDTQAEAKPLLHTWSLAVEAQFYFLFPALLVALSNVSRPLRLLFVMSLAVISCSVSEIGLQNNPAFAFFMLPARAWQLLAGSALALSASAKATCRATESRLVHELGACGGLLLIGYSIASFDARTPFPGLSAIVPTAGAALVIKYAEASWLARRILTFPLVVAAGRMSYSLYLWHHPLLAFGRHAVLGEPSAITKLCIIAATCLASYLTWRFVEEPCRDRTRMARGLLVRFAGAGYVLLLCVGLAGWLWNGQLNAVRLASLRPETRAMVAERTVLLGSREECLKRYRAGAAVPFQEDTGRTRVLVLGDSVAEDLYTAVKLSADALPAVDIRRLTLDEPCMRSLAEVIGDRHSDRSDSKDACRSAALAVAQSSLFDEADNIVLCAHWSEYSTHTTHEGALELARALSQSGRRVCVVGIFAMQEASSIAYLAAVRGLSPDAANEAAYRSIHKMRIQTPNEAAEALAAADSNVRFLDKYSIFANDARGVVELYGPAGELYFADNAHLTAAGMSFFGSVIAKQRWFQ